MASTDIAANAFNISVPSGTSGDGSQVTIDVHSPDHGGSGQFRAALERYIEAGAGDAVKGVSGKAGPAGDSKSLGHTIATRATDLASEVKKDQQYVSKLLEQATRTGDSLHLMRAMMALSDFQLRVQTISKTVSKATSSIDSLTKLQ